MLKDLSVSATRWETFSPPFGNGQAGQSFLEGKRSISQKAFRWTRFGPETHRAPGQRDVPKQKTSFTEMFLVDFT